MGTFSFKRSHESRDLIPLGTSSRQRSSFLRAAKLPTNALVHLQVQPRKMVRYLKKQGQLRHRDKYLRRRFLEPKQEPGPTFRSAYRTRRSLSFQRDET